jgi:chitosanase
MAGPADLDDPVKKDHAMQIVSSAENSSLDWRAQFGYIEDIGDGRGYTGGIIGFTSGTHDMLELVQRYTDRSPGNILAKYLPALQAVDGTGSHEGLDPGFTGDWRSAANDPAFRDTQESERDRVYFDPAVSLAKQDGLQALGQFAYYDAAMVHGPEGLQAIRSRALGRAQAPAQGGGETAYLNAFLDERVIEMKKEEAHSDTSRDRHRATRLTPGRQPGARHAAALARLRRPLHGLLTDEFGRADRASSAGPIAPYAAGPVWTTSGRSTRATRSQRLRPQAARRAQLPGPRPHLAQAVRRVPPNHPADQLRPARHHVGRSLVNDGNPQQASITLGPFD